MYHREEEAQFLHECASIIFALLTNKREDKYTRLFNKLATLCQTNGLQLNLDDVMADFEAGIIKNR